MANAPLHAQRPRLDSLDNSADATGPATPYHPEGDSRADLYAGPSSVDGDPLPHSGYRTTSRGLRFDRRMLAVAAIAYVVGALSAAAAFLSLR